MKYVGITPCDFNTSKTEISKAEISKGRNLRDFKVIKNNLTYEEAKELEDKIIGIYRKCEKSPGGLKETGRVYSVYTYE